MSHHDIVVIGGGQAGLAVGHYLSRDDRDFTILDAGDGPAAAWRARWDSLRLFTPARYDGLPGMPFPGDPDHYPTRDEVVAYLSAYARPLPVEYDSRVTALEATASGYRIALADRTLDAGQVVVATGPFQVPRVPAIGGQLDPGVEQLHSTAYRNPGQVADGAVLVVGGGNTGHQIAAELAATHDVHLAIGSRQPSLPQRVLGRDVFDALTAVGAMRVTVDSRLGRRLAGREALIGSTPRGARRAGARLHPRVTAAGDSTVTFADASTLQPTTVIWATGFTTDHRWIDAPIFGGNGRLIHERGVTAAPGLFFVGLPWQHTRGSALLGWVRDDAEYIARAISGTGRARPAVSPAAAHAG